MMQQEVCRIFEVLLQQYIGHRRYLTFLIQTYVRNCFIVWVH